MVSFTLTKKLLVFFTLKVQLPVFLQTKATFLFTVSVTLQVSLNSKCPAVATVQVSASKEKASSRLYLGISTKKVIFNHLHKTLGFTSVPYFSQQCCIQVALKKKQQPTPSSDVWLRPCFAAFRPYG